MFTKAFPDTGKSVTLIFEGKALTVSADMTVAAAVLGHGAKHLRTTAKSGEERAPYCHMGVCFDCLMEIDGVPNQQACLRHVEEGMRVRRQQGAPDLARTEEE